MAQIVKIDRAIWNTGERYADSQLVTEMRQKYDRCKCCLAFLGEACAVYEDDMVDVALPYDITGAGDWPPALFELSSATLGEEAAFPDRWDSVLAAINDSQDVDDEMREEWISTGFKILFDMDVEFTGQYGEDQIDEAYDDDEPEEGDRYGH